MHQIRRKTENTGPSSEATKGDKKSTLSEIKRMKVLIPYTKGNRKLLIAPAILIPLIIFLQVANPQMLRLAVDEGVMRQDGSALTKYALLFLLIVIGSYLARTTQALASIVFVQRMINKIRNELVAHVLKLKSRYHDKNMSGALVTRATSDFDNLSESLNFGVLNTLVDLSTLLGSTVAMYMLNWKLALVTTVMLPIVMYTIRRFSVSIKTNMLASRKKIAKLNAYAQESLYGNSTLKLLTAEQSAQDRHHDLNIDYRNSQMKVVVLDAFLFSVLDGISSVTIGLVLWTATSNFLGNGHELTAGVMVAFVGLVQQLFDPLKQLGSTMAMLQGVFTSIERIFGILSTKDFVAGQNPLIARPEIRFENVYFSYEKGSQDILKGIDLNIRPHESIAIVGSTGSGKSTIIKVLCKLYDGYRGNIFLGDQEIRDVAPESLRSHIAIVPQDIVLFDGSVAFNIGLGAKDVSDEDIQKAAKIVGADTFISKLPGKYEYKIKERGSNLSQGQRQLIAFARALSKNPDFIILDEATASVDPASERNIQAALENILEHKTVIVIAHRLSTIKKCDQIVVMERGKIIEKGTHDSLVAEKNRYFDLVNEFASTSNIYS